MNRKTLSSTMTLTLLLLIPFFTLAFSSCRKSADPKADGTNTNSDHVHTESRITDSQNGSGLTADSQNNKPSLSQLTRNARSWQPTLTSWQGKAAPEISIKALNGKALSISDHKGKDVMLVFWATWCPPCRMEIPHLKHLREQKKDSELEIIAISNENPQTVKNFVNSADLNYTVATMNSYSVPAPYSRISGIPTTMFIDPQGKIKIITTGVMTTEETKAVLEAQN